MAVFLQSLFEKLVVGIADYVFKEVLLLYLHEAHFEFLLLDELQILVESLNTEIDGLRLVVFYQIALVGEKILSRHLLVPFKEVGNSPDIGTDGIRSQILVRKECFVLGYHIIFNIG